MIKKWVKKIFKPTKLTIIIFLVYISHVFYFIFSDRGIYISSNPILDPIWPISFPLIPLFVLSHIIGNIPISGENGIFLLIILGLLIIYIVIHLIIYYSKLLFRKNKWYSVLLIVIFIFLTGFDQIIVNLTINRPILNCNVDSDCAEKHTSRSPCGNKICANSDWNLYESAIQNVYASFGFQCSNPVCACEQNKCVTQSYVREDPYVDNCEDKCTSLKFPKINASTSNDCRNKNGAFVAGTYPDIGEGVCCCQRSKVREG